MDTADRDVIFRAINRLTSEAITPTRNAILDLLKQRKRDERTLDVLDDMIASGSVARSGDAYVLTEAGRRVAQHASAKQFSDWMMSHERSAVYRTFCQQVYGIDLCLFNMMTQTQLATLLQVLGASHGQHILDLGCGTGALTEYIADHTGGMVMGIDFAADAITFAQAKTRGKVDRLSFHIMDMDDLRLPPQQFDVILSIDTLYFVSDLRKTVTAMKTSLKPNGQMGIFYSAEIGADQPKEVLAPTATPLAKVLSACGLTFDTWEFTADEKDFWNKQVQIANALKHEFETEGNRSLYEDLIDEASEVLELHDRERIRRYFYHVQR